MHMDYTAMGHRIRAARKSRGMTQAEMAEKIGVSASFYGHIERGSRVASLETTAKLCTCLHISADYLLGLSLDSAVNMLPDNLTDQQKHIALTMINGAIKALTEDDTHD